MHSKFEFQTLKIGMQALFLIQIPNKKSDFLCFDFLFFLGIESESNHIKHLNLSTQGLKIHLSGRQQELWVM